MFGWLAAAAAPWLIHLFSRRKYRETAWAAMDFLMAAVKRRTRRIQIEHWLLLLLRTASIVAIVLAVAEPFFEHPCPVLRPGGRTHRVLVIDGSYSMAFKTGDRSRFQQAKQWAARIVEKSSPGDGFTLIEMADPPRAIVGTPAFEAASIRQEIENLEILHTSADLAATLAEVRKVIDTARRESPRLVRHEVYFVGDLQRGTWLPSMSDAARADFRKRAAELAEIADLEVIDLGVIDLGQGAAENLAVTSLAMHDPLVLAGRSVEIEAAVRDFGHTARPHQPVDLLVDEHPAARQYVDVPAGGTVSVRFNYRFETPGDHAVEARSLGDGLDVDNHRYLAVTARPAMRVLCIDGRPSGDPRRTTVYNLANALAASGSREERSPAEIETATESAIQERDLGAYDCVALCNVAQFTASEARLLDGYLGRGGSLVFFLGDQVRGDRYNAELTGQGSTPAILPGRLKEIVEKPRGSLDPLGYRHPIVQEFRGQEKSGLLTSPVTKYFKVELATDLPSAKRGEGRIAAQVVLAMHNGDPLVVAATVRRGRVVLVTTSADTSWAAMPLWPSYLPLVEEILAWSTGGQATVGNVEVGEPLQASLRAVAGVASVAIERPDGRRRWAPLESHGDYSSWSYDDTYHSGVYTVHCDLPGAAKRLFAVNLRTAESDLSPITKQELQEDVWPGISFGYETTSPGDGIAPSNSVGHSSRIQIGLLYGVVGLLFLESLLAWQFGYQKT